MSVMIEAWLATPVDAERETQISATLARIRGRETYRELELNSICITIEFDDWETARNAVDAIQRFSTHIEGPMEYGNDGT